MRNFSDKDKVTYANLNDYVAMAPLEVLGCTFGDAIFRLDSWLHGNVAALNAEALAQQAAEQEAARTFLAAQALTILKNETVDAETFWAAEMLAGLRHA